MRRVFKFLLIFSLLLTPFGFADTFAAQDTAGMKKLENQASQAFNKALSKNKEGKYQIDGMTVNIDLDYVVVDKKNKKVAIQETKPVKNKAVRVEGATLAHAIIFVPPERKNNSYPGQGSVYTMFEVVDTDGPIGPLNIEATVDVKTSNYKKGPFNENFSKIHVDWNWFQISEGKREFRITEVKNTKFYQVNYDVTVQFLTAKDSVSVTWQPLLANKKAFEYPCRYYDPQKTRVPATCHGGDHLYQVLYEDPYSDKVMFTPETTLMPTVPPTQRVPWDNILRGKYISEYIRKYGDPTKKDPNFKWGDYDIHHIIPREYGGTNDFNNLIPLKRDFHSQNVTPWWTNY